MMQLSTVRHHNIRFALTAGKKERAEPRWLLPIICRLGHITKREVGSIKIGDKETRFEIKAKDADRFMDAVTASGGGEKSVRIFRDGDKQPAASKAYKKDKAPKPKRPKADTSEEQRGSEPSSDDDVPSDESWVPSLDEMERPKSSVKPRGKPAAKSDSKPAGKTKKKEKWSRAKKNAAKNKRADVARKKKTASKADGKSSTGNEPLKRAR